MARNITSRRKLSDLYAVGVEVRFGPTPEGPLGRIGPFLDEDGKPRPLGGDEIAMWVTPPSPLQREMSLRDAQAARARAMIRAKRDHDSEEHLTSMVFVTDMDEETLVDYLLLSTSDSRRDEAVREVLSAEEWSDITAIQDALRQFDEEGTPESDPEYAAVLTRDVEYGRQVSERQKQLTESAREGLKMLSREALENRALAKRSEIAGSQAFMSEYERQMTFFAVRDPDDHRLLFFESAREWADQPDAVHAVVADALSRYIQDGGQAKNSPRAESGSESSEPPSKPETSEVSTPETVNV